MQEKIGLLGGSFNPIHWGHLAMAEAAREELALDRLLIIPDGDPPHKSKELAGKRHRLRMVELAAEGVFEVSAMEVERPGKTYTVDTLEVLHALHPQALLYMVIGADTLREISGWKQAARVFSLCRFAVFGRDALSLDDVEGAEIVRLQTAIPGISATEIRARVHRGQSLDGYTPRVVEDYIGQHRLYDPPILMGEKAIRKRLRETLPLKRYQHILGVEETARILAARYGYPVEKALLAGLLHDCAKGMNLEQMRRYVQAQGEKVDPPRMENTALLHAPASAAMARAVYGVTDPEILRAIWYHNTGTVPMGTLDKLLAVADIIEPGRKGAPWMTNLRALATTDLDRAARETLRIKLERIRAETRYEHPDSVAALEALNDTIEREEDA